MLVFVAACSGDGEAPIDGAMQIDDSSLAVDGAVDGPPVDAPVTESCTATGWCTTNMPPSYAWALSVAPNDQLWTVAYGATRKVATGWQAFDISWHDLVDAFIVHNELYTVHAVGPNDVWVGGRQGYVGHFNGGTWQEFRPAAPWPQGIWGSATDDVWVLYDSGLRYHWNGTALESKPTSEVRYNGAWGRSATDVWGFGETVISSLYHPAIDHFDGTAWTRTVVPGDGEVISLWASSTSDVYAVVTLNGTTRVTHFDGTTWTLVTDSDVTQINGVWGRAANDVWLVGRQGRIVHFDGTAWTPSASGSTKTLADIGGTATTIWVTGDGVALHRP